METKTSDEHWIAAVSETARMLERAQAESRSLTPSERAFLADTRSKVAAILGTRGLTMGLDDAAAQALAATLSRIRDLAPDEENAAQTTVERVAYRLMTPFPGNRGEDDS